MVYRVEIDISFTDEATALDVANYVASKKATMYVPNPDLKIDIARTIRYHPCYHDETPPKPCGGYVLPDLTRVDEAAVVKAREDAKLAAIEAAKERIIR